MFGLETLDVAIGLIFVYLLLSLICTAANELVEGWLKTRASKLEQGIRELLRDGNNTQLVEKFYEHPLIYGLYEGAYDKARSTRYFGLAGSNLPSYIPSRTFALALMDTILPAQSPQNGNSPTDAKPSGAEGATIPPAVSHPPEAASGVNPQTNTTIPGTTAPLGAPATTYDANPPLQPLRDAIDQMPNKQVRQALLTLVDAAGGDISRARKNIEDWFDSSMDRVSGWYKRHTQARILVFAALVTVFLNANTITIVNRLTNDSALRDIIVAQAQKAVDKKDMAADDLTSSLTRVEKLALPLGWSSMESRWDLAWKDINPWSMVFYHLLGWLITAVALSLGAPFWFDLLNKFMVIRATVKPKEKSPNEPPVDRK